MTSKVVSKSLHAFYDIKDDVVAVKLEALNFRDEYTHSFFLSVKELGTSTPTYDQLKNHKLRRYYYYETLRELKSALGSGTEDFFRVVENAASLDALELLNTNNFDKQNLLYFWLDSHLFYPFEGDIPVSMPKRMDYIFGGLRDSEYDLAKVEKILKENPYVFDIQNVAVPYYNGGGRAIEYTVHLPQQLFDKMVIKYRDKDKAEFWSCRIVDSLSDKYDDPFKILKIRKCRLNYKPSSKVKRKK